MMVRTLLHQACISGSADHVEALITGYNLDPGAVDGSGNTSLHAAALGKGSRVINLLITKINIIALLTVETTVVKLHFTLHVVTISAVLKGLYPSIKLI